MPTGIFLQRCRNFCHFGQIMRGRGFLHLLPQKTLHYSQLGMGKRSAWDLHLVVMLLVGQ